LADSLSIPEIFSGESSCLNNIHPKRFQEDSDKSVPKVYSTSSSPDADTYPYNIKRLGPDTLQKMVNEGIGRMVHEAKHHFEFARPAEVAIDMTYLAY
jgi:hypothetical protein